jgi:hypothetical protein
MRPSPGNVIGSPLRCEGSWPVRLQPTTKHSFSMARARSSVRQCCDRASGHWPGTASTSTPRWK